MTLRLPIPAAALLGLQLVPACHHDDPILGHWQIHELEGAAKPDGVEMTLDIDADLRGDFDFTVSGEYAYAYHTTLTVDARGAPNYVIDVLPTQGLGASQLRCELADDTLTCTDVSGAGLGDPVFKRD